MLTLSLLIQQIWLDFDSTQPNVKIPSLVTFVIFLMSHLSSKYGSTLSQPNVKFPVSVAFVTFVPDNVCESFSSRNFRFNAKIERFSGKRCIFEWKIVHFANLFISSGK